MAGIFQRIFNPGLAYDAASDEMNKYYQQAMQGQQAAQQQFSPYISQGNLAGNQLMQYLSQLSNPEQLEQGWAANYEMSPYAQQLLSKNQSSGMDAASQMGLLGSSAALQNIQNNAGNIVSQDRQQYMNDLMQKFMAGIGLGQNIYGVGANAVGQNANLAENMGNQATNMGDIMGGLKYNQETAGPQMLEKLLGSIGGLGAQYLTGGFGEGNYGRGAFKPVTNKIQYIQPYNYGG